ncbi:hypothetical protein GCM10009754_43420 [Amycolatopsis minnesotensis]|uniref:Immunity protein 35 domain-containing protein n=1 Tax=Amycolatopsis minnesotensis TaxID=337894 RepID=A0ABN2RAU6_9PSEU
MVKAAEAVARVEQWLDDPELRVQPEFAARAADGWYVPYNAAAYLDGTDVGKGLFPAPTVFVPDDGGTITMAADVMTPSPRAPVTLWEEVADPELDPALLHGRQVPVKAIRHWEAVTGTGQRTGEVKPNPAYTVSPVWRGFPARHTAAGKLLDYLNADWISVAQFAECLAMTEVVVPVDDGESPALRGVDDRYEVAVCTSTGTIPAGVTRWRRMLAGHLLRPEAPVGFVLDPGRALSYSLPARYVRAVPLPPPGEPVEEVAAEASPEVLALAERLTADFGIEAPGLLRRHLTAVAGWARNTGYELSIDEAKSYLTGYAVRFSNLRGIRRNRGPSWPADLEANGLTTHYDHFGAPSPVPWTFGKFDPRNTPPGTFAWHRLVGAFAGFAAGEALVSGDGLGPLTRQLLRHTESVLRGLPQVPRTFDIPPGFPPPASPSSWLAVALGDDREAEPALSPLLLPLAAITAAGAEVAGMSQDYPKAIARDMAGTLTESTATALDALDSLDALIDVLWELLKPGDYALPVYVHLRTFARDERPGIGELARTVLELRDDRDTDDRAQIETIGDGHTPLSLLGRALFAAGKRHYDAEAAFDAAAGDPLVSALTGALLGARGGIPGLPRRAVAAVGRIGLVENVASDAFWNFTRFGVRREPSARHDWERQRYPRG